MEITKQLLIHAARISDEQVLTELLKGNANVNVTDEDGCTPLIIATKNNNLFFVEHLILAGANVNTVDKDGNTPLILAAFNNQTAIAELLLENGAAINQQNQHGSTALMLAVKYLNNDTVKVLMLHGADQTICDSKGMRATDFAEQQGNEVAIALLQA